MSSEAGPSSQARTFSTAPIDGARIFATTVSDLHDAAQMLYKSEERNWWFAAACITVLDRLREHHITFKQFPVDFAADNVACEMYHNAQATLEEDTRIVGDLFLGYIRSTTVDAVLTACERDTERCAAAPAMHSPAPVPVPVPVPVAGDIPSDEDFADDVAKVTQDICDMTQAGEPCSYKLTALFYTADQIRDMHVLYMILADNEAGTGNGTNIDADVTNRITVRLETLRQCFMQVYTVLVDVADKAIPAILDNCFHDEGRLPNGSLVPVNAPAISRRPLTQENDTEPHDADADAAA